MSAATTRFDAPLLLGRVVKHPMSVIETTFDAAPFDRGIREGFLEILGAMTQPGFNALTYPPPASESPRFGPRDPVVGAVYPGQGCAMTFPAGQLLPDAPLTYVERGLLIHGDRLLVIAPVGGGGESAEVSHKVIVNISPDEYGALDSAAQESLLAQLEVDPPEAATRETAREFHDLVNRTHLAAQGLWPYNLEHRDVEQFTRFNAPLMLGVADRVRLSPNLTYFNAVPFDRPIRDGVVEVLNLMRTPGFEPLRYPPMRGYDPENETDDPGVVKGAVLPSIGAALSFEAGLGVQGGGELAEVDRVCPGQICFRFGNPEQRRAFIDLWQECGEQDAAWLAPIAALTEYGLTGQHWTAAEISALGSETDPLTPWVHQVLQSRIPPADLAQELSYLHSVDDLWRASNLLGLERETKVPTSSLSTYADVDVDVDDQSSYLSSPQDGRSIGL